MESKTILYTKNRDADLVNMIAAEVSTFPWERALHWGLP